MNSIDVMNALKTISYDHVSISRKFKINIWNDLDLRLHLMVVKLA